MKMRLVSFGVTVPDRPYPPAHGIAGVCRYPLTDVEGKRVVVLGGGDTKWIVCGLPSALMLPA